MVESCVLMLSHCCCHETSAEGMGGAEAGAEHTVPRSLVLPELLPLLSALPVSQAEPPSLPGVLHIWILQL